MGSVHSKQLFVLVYWSCERFQVSSYGKLCDVYEKMGKSGGNLGKHLTPNSGSMISVQASIVTVHSSRAIMVTRPEVSFTVCV